MVIRSRHRRVVVTGVGALSAAGGNAHETFRATIDGHSAMRRIQQFDTEGFPVNIAAEIALDSDGDDDRYYEWGLMAADMAVRSARVEAWDDPRRVGVLVGTALGSLARIEAAWTSNKVEAVFGSRLAHGISRKIGSHGPSLMINSSFASGADAIGIGVQKIRNDAVDIVIAGGSEAPITPTIVAGFASLGALADADKEPGQAIRPFDRNRHGCGLGEGAAFLVLEERDAALARGANIMAEVLGYGTAMDAFHITQLPPDGNGLRRAIHLAMSEANLGPEDIDYINAHGTGTDMNDRIETAVIKQVLGKYAYSTPMSSTKAVTGHLLGAAGALEAAITVMALQAQLAPPTINWSTRDPDCDLDYVPNVAREMDLKIVMTNSMGFGGHNASLILKGNLA